MSERTIQNEASMSASKIGDRLLRNNVGTCWQGEWKMMKDGSVLIKNARRVQYGLAVGSGDLIGYHRHKVTMADVGKIFAIFTSAENKTDNKKKRSKEQINWDQHIQQAGGISVLINKLTSPSELAEMFSDAMARILK